MGKMIRFEFNRLFNQRSFYICTLIMAAMILITSIMAGTFADVASADSLCGWDNVSVFIQMSQILTVFPIFASIFVCDDFNSGIIKNIYSRGYSRGKVYLGKYISSLFSMFLMYIFIAVFSFVVGTIMWGAGSMEDIPVKIALQFIVMIGYHGLFYTIAIIIGRTGGAIAVNIIGTSFIPLILNLLESLLKLKKVHLTDYWIDSFLETAGSSSSSSGDIAKAVVLSLVYAVVFFIAGFAINSKKQV